MFSVSDHFLCIFVLNRTGKCAKSGSINYLNVKFNFRRIVPLTQWHNYQLTMGLGCAEEDPRNFWEVSRV